MVLSTIVSARISPARLANKLQICLQERLDSPFDEQIPPPVITGASGLFFSQQEIPGEILICWYTLF